MHEAKMKKGISLTAKAKNIQICLNELCARLTTGYKVTEEQSAHYQIQTNSSQKKWSIFMVPSCRIPPNILLFYINKLIK